MELIFLIIGLIVLFGAKLNEAGSNYEYDKRQEMYKKARARYADREVKIGEDAHYIDFVSSESKKEEIESLIKKDLEDIYGRSDDLRNLVNLPWDKNFYAKEKNMYLPRLCAMLVMTKRGFVPRELLMGWSYPTAPEFRCLEFAKKMEKNLNEHFPGTRLVFGVSEFCGRDQREIVIDGIRMYKRKELIAIPEHK